MGAATAEWSSAAAALVGVLRNVSANAAPGLVDALVITTQCSRSSLLLGLLQRFSDIYQGDVGSPAAPLVEGEADAIHAYLAMVLHLLKHRETEAVDLLRALWTVFIPILRSKNPESSVLLIQVADMLAEATSIRCDWDIVKSSVVPLCLNSLYRSPTWRKEFVSADALKQIAYSDWRRLEIENKVVSRAGAMRMSVQDELLSIYAMTQLVAALLTSALKASSNAEEHDQKRVDGGPSPPQKFCEDMVAVFLAPALAALAQPLDEPLRRYCMNNLLPPVLRSAARFGWSHDVSPENRTKDARTSAMQEVWFCCQTLLSHGSSQRRDAYTALALFAELLLPPDTKQLMFSKDISDIDPNGKFDIRLEPEFWDVLKLGLGDQDSLTRKRALYILKRAISGLKSSRDGPQNLGVDNGSSQRNAVVESSGKASRILSTKRNKWADEEAASLGVVTVKQKMTLVKGWSGQWDAFILLHETLEEYGTHLVEAAWSHQMSLLLQFTNSKGDAKDSGPYWAGTWSQKKLQSVDVNFSWISVLWQRGFDHTNPQVRRLVMQSFLMFEWERIQKLSSLLQEDYVLGPLLEALDDAVQHRDFGMKGSYSSATAEGAVKFMSAYGASVLPRQQVDFVMRMAKALLSQSRTRPGLMTLTMCLEAAVVGMPGGKPKPVNLVEDQMLPTGGAEIIQSEEGPAGLLELLKSVVESSKCHFNPKYRAKVCSHVLGAISTLIPVSHVPFSRFAIFLSSFPRDLLIYGGSLHKTLMSWVYPTESGSVSRSGVNKWVLEGLQNMVQVSLKSYGPFASPITDEDVGAWRMEAGQLARLLAFGLVENNDVLGILTLIQQHVVPMYNYAYTTVGRPERVLILIHCLFKEYISPLDYSSNISCDGDVNNENADAGESNANMLRTTISTMVLSVLDEIKDYARCSAAVFWENDPSAGGKLPPSVIGKLGGPSQRRLPSTLTTAVLQAVIAISTVADCCLWCCQVSRQLEIPESVLNFLWQFAWQATATPIAMNELSAELQLAALEALTSVSQALAATAHPFYVTAAHASMNCKNEISSLIPVKAELMVDGLMEALLHINDDSALVGALARSRRAVLAAHKWSCLDSLLSIPKSAVSDDRMFFKVNKLLSAASSPILEGLLQDCINSLESAGEEYLLPLLQCIRWLMKWGALTLVEADDDPEKKYQIMWKLVQSGWLAMGDCNKRKVASTSAFLSAIFHPAIFGDRKMHGSQDKEEYGPLKWLLNRLIEQGSRSPRTMRLTALHVTGLWLMFPGTTMYYLPELKILALHGGESVDEELDGEILESKISAQEYATLIESCDPELSEQFTNSEMYVRVMVAIMVHKFASLVEDPTICDDAQLQTKIQAANFGQIFLLELLNAAATDTDLSKELYKKKSAVHRRKVRVWQLLCILSRFLSADVIPKVFSLLKICLYRNNMPSVRQYIETFSVQFFLRFPHLVEELLLPVLLDYNMKSQALSSYVLIASNVVMFTPAPKQRTLLQQILPAVLPFMTSHHHSLRSFTQVLICRIFHRFSDSEGLFNIKQRPFSEGQCLKSIADYLEGNADCTRMRISVEKHLDAFDPLSSTQPRGIFCSKGGEVDPSRSAEDHPFECVPVAFLDQVGYFLSEAREELRESMAANAMVLRAEPFSRLQTAVGTPEPHNNPHSSTLEGQSQMGILNGVTANITSLSGGPVVTQNIDSMANVNWDIQKKIASLRFNDANSAYYIEEELLLSTIESRAKELIRMRGGRQDLIVVASLLGRVPNLAGLARTCEVFKASSLVVADVRIAEDRQFQLISVTADQWIPLVEVTEAALNNYLNARKKEGYCVIGLEQTANSKSIDKYSFPTKVVLVLGRESDGIPVEIIQTLDTCVEIPQLGVIRSLNVHVSGAIAIWEYTRQHLISKREAATCV